MDTPKLTPDDFPVTIELSVQWGEQDGFGHVNNMYFIRWFESSRIAYLRKCDMRVTADGVGPILAQVSCNYRRQVKFPDTVVVGARIVRIGRSSVGMEHALWSKAQELALCAHGDSTIVRFDYHSQKSTPIPDDIRETIRNLEGKPL